MNIEQTLQNEIQDSKKALDGPIDDTVYRRNHSKRIELIKWVLENMKKPDLRICEVMESKMNEIIDKINQTHDIFEADKLHSELGILESIIYQVCSNEIKQIERL
ncbi:MAG: hypothetical protein ABR515_07750 [Nitrososphaeraceae archaeon]